MNTITIRLMSAQSWMQWFFRPSRRSRPCRRLGKSLSPSSRDWLSWRRSRSCCTGPKAIAVGAVPNQASAAATCGIRGGEVCDPAFGRLRRGLRPSADMLGDGPAVGSDRLRHARSMPVNDVYEFDPELQAVYSGAHQYLAAAVARRWIAEHPETIVGSVQSIKADFEADVHRYVRLSRFRELLVEAGYKIDRNDRPRQ